MCIFLKYHLKNQSLKYNKSIPSDYKKILKKINDIPQLGDYKILFLLIKDNCREELNATSLVPKYIICSLEWAAQIILNNDSDTINAFKITIGHELAHKNGNCKMDSLKIKDRIFANWVKEVHADFYASQQMFASDRNALLSSCQYKYKYKISHNKKDVDTTSHPSWKKREYYVRNYDFNKILINKIAMDTNCKNTKLINNIISFYDEINLY